MKGTNTTISPNIFAERFRYKDFSNSEAVNLQYTPFVNTLLHCFHN